MSGATKITLGVSGFQNALLSSETASSACSSVMLGSSTEMRREVKSGSKITLNPASFAIVSNTTRASLVIFRLIGSSEIGFSSGGPCSRSLSSDGFGLSLVAASAEVFAAISDMAFLIS